MKNIFNILFGRRSKPKLIKENSKRIKIGDWCKVHSSNLSIHPEDRETWENYPFRSEIHLCIAIDKGFYRIRFSGITIRVLGNSLIKVKPPQFLPYEQINYLTTKGKLEYARIIGYVNYYRPEKERAYTIKVKDKVKSNRYRSKRLSRTNIPYDRSEFNEKLSKTISYILRHRPEEYEIHLDKNGWVEIDNLINRISSKDSFFRGLTFYDISLMIDHSQKKRHELKAIKREPLKNRLEHHYDWKIRANYGHSINQKIEYGISEPPSILYHGTNSESFEKILTQGIRPMSRQYVHLSSDIETAQIVALRRSKDIVILEVLAKEASENGQEFYKVDDFIWLTNKLEIDYITNRHDH